MEETSQPTTVAEEEFRKKLLIVTKQRAAQPLSKLMTDVCTDKLSYLAGKTEEDILAISRGHSGSEDILAKGERPDYDCARTFCIALLNRVDSTRIMMQQTVQLMSFVADTPIA